MNIDYKVGDLIYDANIYDGMNTDLSDLQFYKRWLPQSKGARILELCCGTGRLTLPIARDDMILVELITLPQCLPKQDSKLPKQD
jgi:2-polyprenyl-3-methyl-5-hydroxy-6-metoxy-1,4-benzoquinol methylase